MKMNHKLFFNEIPNDSTLAYVTTCLSYIYRIIVIIMITDGY